MMETEKDDIGKYVKFSIGAKLVLIISVLTILALGIITLLVTIFGRNSNEMADRAKFGFLAALFTAFLLALAFVFSSGAQESPFLYFNF